MVDGYECCYECGEEFYFSINPLKDIFITCPTCHTKQHACSLCDNPTDCSGNKCKYSILKSLKEYGYEI